MYEIQIIRAIHEMDFYVFHGSLSAYFGERRSLCRITAFTKTQAWTFTRKAFFFSKIKNRSRRAQVLLTATRAGERKLGRERQKERWKRRWESLFKLLNEIKALCKTPMISIVEFISPSSTTIMGSSDLNPFFSTVLTDCLLAFKVTIIVIEQKKT